MVVVVKKIPRKNKNPEKLIENQILKYLSYLPECFAWKNNSGGVYDPVKKLFRKTRNIFAINGVTDIVGIYKGRPLFIEVKTPLTRNNVSDEQKWFLEKAKKHGAIAFVATSIDDVMMELSIK